MSQFIAVDSDRCIGCGTCLIACSTAHEKAGRQTNPRLVKVLTRDLSATVSCHHCQDAPCAQVCPVQAVQRQGDVVVVDEKICISCKLCALACPFGSIRMSGTSVAGVAGVKVETQDFPKKTSDIIAWTVGVHAAAVKCDLCRFKADSPSCVAACPTGAVLLLSESVCGELNVAKHRRAAQEAASTVHGITSFWGK